jgi:hypothetical protein
MPVIEYAVERITDNGINHLFTRLSLDSIALGTPLMPGTERPMASMIRGMTKSVIDPNTGQFTDEGKPLRYELRAVLFADGTYYGIEGLFVEFSGNVANIRSMARDTQCLADKYTAVEQERGAFNAWVKSPKKASIDVTALNLRSNIADIVLTIKAHDGEDGAEAAIARIAALPDVVKGE